jgi:hypothetical protein
MKPPLGDHAKPIPGTCSNPHPTGNVVNIPGTVSNQKHIEDNPIPGTVSQQHEK